MAWLSCLDMSMANSYSALKFHGVRYYELARLYDAQQGQGSPVEALPQPQARLVTISKIELMSVSFPTVTMAVTCGSGTYIRSLVRDLGVALGSLATMTRLERTAQGPFDARSCHWQPVRELGDELSSVESLMRRLRQDSAMVLAYERSSMLGG